MSLRNAIFAATLIEFLKSGSLLTLEQVNDRLGGKDVSRMKTC